MKIPEKVKVGPFDYQVIMEEKPFVDGGNALDGIHIYDKNIIKVAKSGSQDYQNQVFLHELMHAIIAVYADNNQNEYMVEQVSKGLYQVINDHPDMFK